MTDEKTTPEAPVEEPKISEEEMVAQLELSSVVEATERESNACLNGVFRQMFGAVDTDLHPNAKRMIETELTDINAQEMIQGAGLNFTMVPEMTDAATGRVVKGKAYLSIVVTEHDFNFHETVLSAQINKLNEIRSRIKGNKFIDAAFDSLSELVGKDQEETKE